MTGDGKRGKLRTSIFPKVPPYHVFLPPWEDYSCPPCDALRQEEWQFPAQIMPVVQDVVEHSGFKTVKGVLRSDDEQDVIMSGFIWDNLPLVEKAMDAIDFRRLKAGVKINKFPGFFDLNRKDLLWHNFQRMQEKFGREEFGFHPDTFRLPAEHKELVERMKSEKYSKVYIVKLPNNYCGIGACVIDHPKKIPKKTKVHVNKLKKVTKEDPIIVQSYIPNPLLINGYKFDFRIYVLVTSINPLRIYLYKDGLVRFATEKFSLEPEDLANTFIHLTNFTVNKKGEVVGDYPPGTQVNKWSISELWSWFRDRGVDPEPFWSGVKDVVIKTLLCGHESIARKVGESVGSFYNNFNLLGLDIFIDTDYKPYLLEVNTIPSLFINNVSREIDLRLKAPLVAETLNITGHHISTGVAARHKADIIKAHLGGEATNSLGYDHRLYCKVLSEDEKEKQLRFCRLDKIRREQKNEEETISKRSDSNGNTSPQIERKGEGFKEEASNGNSEEGTGSDLQEEAEEDVDCSEYSEYSYYSDSVEGSEEPEVTKEIVGKETELKNEENDNKEDDQDDSEDILKKLTPCDIRVLIHSEEELTQCETFERIFPTSETDRYIQYTSGNYYDLLLSAWEHKYSGDREQGRRRLGQLTAQGKHLEVPASEKKTPHPPPRSPKEKKNFNLPHIFR